MLANKFENAVLALAISLLDVYQDLGGFFCEV